MSRPVAILFDWDNTLVDSWACIQQAMNATLTAMGHPVWDLDETKRRVALSMKDSFPTLFGARWPQARDIFYDTFASIHLNFLDPLPGAADTLRRLHSADIPLGVISNKAGRFLRKEAESLGWKGYFRHLAGAGDAAADKPSDLPVRQALDAIGVAADHNVWFIGDAAIDMECASNAGVFPVLVKHDAWREGEFDRHPPARHFQSWSAFGLYLDEILVP
jgi:phosphoglycolate phosphatase